MYSAEEVQTYIRQTANATAKATAEEVERRLRADRGPTAHTKAVLTTREVADEYGVETDTVLRWVRDGLRATKRGRQYLYRRDDVEAFLVPTA